MDMQESLLKAVLAAVARVDAGIVVRIGPSDLLLHVYPLLLNSKSK